MEESTSSATRSPDRSNPALELSFLTTTFHVIQFSPSDSIPQQILDAITNPTSPPFISISRTPYETSIILPTSLYESIYSPASDCSAPLLPRSVEGPWSCLMVRGPMDLSLTGIMHALCGPLKNAGVPVFASSTWYTDYVLVNASKKEQARKALEDDGWRFSD